MYLTGRGVLLLLVAAPIIALGTWAPALEWAALVYGLICLGLFAMDWRLAGSGDRFELRREHDSRLSLGAENLIRLSVRNRSRRAVDFSLRDEAPDAFEIERRIHHGTVSALGLWRGRYHVRPLRRGDYAFGDLILRWHGPLQLVVRQARMPAGQGVKVYPNLLDVRRYDLLLKQNRLQELGLRHARLFGEGTEFERLRSV